MESRRLPQDADLEGLSATYEGGVLRVTIPRLQLAPAPRYYQQHHVPPAMGPRRQQQQQMRRGGFPMGQPGFWGDPDVWW